MGLIVKPVEVAGDKGKATLQALFDSGASGSFIRRGPAEKIGTLSRWLSPRTFTHGDGKARLQAQDFLPADITIKGVTVFFPLLVVDELSDEVIIGADMLQRWKITLDPEKEDVFIDERVTRLRL